MDWSGRPKYGWYPAPSRPGRSRTLGAVRPSTLHTSLIVRRLHAISEHELKGAVLWRSKATKASQRKEIVRLLVRDVWLLNRDEPRQTWVRLHWQTGAISEGGIERRRSRAEEQRTPEAVVTRVLELNNKLLGPKAIAEQLNREGLKTGGGVSFTPKAVSYLLATRNVTTATQRINGEDRREKSGE